MIVGMGCDIVDNARIVEMFERFGQRFAEKILSKAELVVWPNVATPVPYLAKRFAAKEAFAKALGTGFHDGLWLTHIGVVNNELGKPECVTEDIATKLLEAHGVTHTHISLSDERTMSMAMVVLEKRD